MTRPNLVYLEAPLGHLGCLPREYIIDKAPVYKCFCGHFSWYIPTCGTAGSAGKATQPLEGCTICSPTVPGVSTVLCSGLVFFLFFFNSLSVAVAVDKAKPTHLFGRNSDCFMTGVSSGLVSIMDTSILAGGIWRTEQMQTHQISALNENPRLAVIDLQDLCHHFLSARCLD